MYYGRRWKVGISYFLYDDDDKGVDFVEGGNFLALILYLNINIWTSDLKLNQILSTLEYFNKLSF